MDQKYSPVSAVQQIAMKQKPEDPQPSYNSVLRRYLSDVIVLVMIAVVNVLILFVARPKFQNPRTHEEMTWQPYVVLNSVAVSIWLMAIGLPADLILMCVSGSFCILRIIETKELLEGLSNSGVVAVAVLCVVSKAVDKTKALNGLMSACLGEPKSTAVAMLRMAFPVVSLGTVFNNTPLVAVMIPIVKSWTNKVGLEVSHFMMPLSFVTMLSACFTTMGSSTNLLAVDLVPDAHIQFLDLAPVGAVIALVGVTYCAIFAPIMLPANGLGKVEHSDPAERTESYNTVRQKEFDSERYTARFVLGDQGPLLSYSAAECGLLKCLAPPVIVCCLHGAEYKKCLSPGDEIEVQNATADDIASIHATPGVDLLSPWARHRSSSHLEAYSAALSEEGTFAREHFSFFVPVRKWIAASVEGGWRPTQRPLFELVISPGGLRKAGRNSFMQEQNLRDLQVSLSEYNLTLIAMRGSVSEPDELVSLGGGEVLLVEALANDLPASTKARFRMVLPVAEGLPPRGLRLSPIDPLRPVLSVLGLVSCVVLSALRIVPLDSLALLVGLSSILLGTLTSKEFYGAINGPVLLTVAASFGLGEAFAKTGVASFLAETVLGVAEQGGQFIILGSIVGLALTLGVVVSNNTTVILLAPLVQNICEKKGLNLKMMMLAVVYAANLSFATPFSYQTNMMVMPHGGYVFMDYVKFGIPMMLLCGIVAILGTSFYWGASS